MPTASAISCTLTQRFCNTVFSTARHKIGYTIDTPNTIHPESKQQSMQWKHASSPSPRKFKVQALAGKIMCIIFRDAEGMLLIDFMSHKVTITGVYYADLLHKLCLAIKEKRRGKLTKVPLLLHNKCTCSQVTCWTSCYT